tara:strand:+ start:2080 stop:2451 length:372 start_codon:yes stop_codon:yes gene_type:complete
MLSIWLFFLKGSPTSNHSTEVIQTDTIYINRPYKEVIIKEVIKPQKIYIHKTDTLIRERLIHDTLFLAMELNKNILKIHIITPEGIPIIKQHQLPDFQSLNLDHKGNIEIKLKKNQERSFGGI